MFVFFIIQTLVMLLLSFLFSLFFPRISNVRPLFRSPPHSAFVPQKLKVDFRRYVRILYHSDSGNAAPLLPLLSVLPPHLQRKTCKFFFIRFQCDSRQLVYQGPSLSPQSAPHTRADQRGLFGRFLPILPR